MKLDAQVLPIRLILCDVDGVMTDGGIVFDNQGIEAKQFHVRDGLGVRLWRDAGGQFGLLTARTSHIVKVRAAELGVDLVRQGFADKLPVAQQIMTELGFSSEQVCYVGDDLTDLQLMSQVGLAVAVADAVEEVIASAHFVTKLGGGKGAVREVVEMLLKGQNRWDDMVHKYR